MAKLVYTDKSGREITEVLGPESPTVTVGRARDCTIRSNRKSVSRRHAKFRYNDGRYEVIDLDSSNGTYIIVDNRRKPVGEPEPLTHRDEIWCGDFILYFIDEQQQSAPVDGGVHSNMGRSSGSVGGAGASSQAPVERGGQSPPPGGVGGGVSMGREGAAASVEGDVARNSQAATGPPSSVSEGGVGIGDEATVGESIDDLQGLRSEKDSIQAMADRQSHRADELEEQLQNTQDELAEVRAELDRVQTQLDEANQQLAEAEDVGENVEQLHQTIENRDRDLEILEQELEREVEAGQRLQDSLDEYEQRIDVLEAERDELKSQIEQTGAGASTAAATEDELQELVDLARSLDRTVDAIDRTDLSPLSTVDRVRLESAIRDTQPRETLHRMLEIVGADDE